MDNFELIASFFRWESAELKYKQLFNMVDYSNFLPVPDWSTFITKLKIICPKLNLPDDSPSDISQDFSENNFFLSDPNAITQPYRELKYQYPQKKRADIAAFKHLRFLPSYYHRLNFPKFLFVANGEVNVFISNKKYILKKGDICFIPPKTTHAIGSFSDNNVLINIIIKEKVFENVLIPVLYEQTELSNYFWNTLYNHLYSEVLLIKNVFTDEIFQSVISIYNEYFFEKKPNNLILKGNLISLLGSILKTSTQNLLYISSEGNSSSDDMQIGPVIRFIMNNIQFVTLNVVANKFDYSESYLSRLIKQKTGKTFSQLIAGFKLEKSKAMLKNSKIPIDQIALNMGYNDISSFYHSFKANLEMTPGEYRDKHQLDSFNNALN